MESTNLLLPYILPAQAQKHVTHNEAIRALDALVQLSVLDRHRDRPPAAPNEGDRHIVGPNAGGAWAGAEGRLAAWQDGAWNVLTPREGWLAWVAGEAQLLVFSGGDWQAASKAPPLQEIPLFGLGTTADAANPFSAKLNAALWAARPRGEGGTGDLRYVLNKDEPFNVLSLLFGTAYSARAELGLVGNDDLTLKVSADGSAFFIALQVDGRTGRPAFPNGMDAASGLRLLPGPVTREGDGLLWHDAASGRLMATTGGRSGPLQAADLPVVRPDPGQWLRTASPTTTTTTTVGVASNRAVLYPFMPRYDAETGAAGLNVTTAAAGALARISAFESDASGRPSRRIAESGTLNCGSTGIKETALALSLRAGRQIWIGLRTSATITVSSWQAHNSPDLDSASIALTANKTLQRALPFDQALPADWGPSSGEASTGTAPAVWLRAA